ncbi:hypothetical protein [Planctomicrobium sp. SH527]|uniref:hypothetical protein n=1 Tax=Planctomicrobium sp. SH527 TaxID=3448123 RepID=UPI003F5C8B73
MDSPLFTFGFATRDDKMAYATLVDFRTKFPHLLDRTEIIIIDNSEQVIKDGQEQTNRYAIELHKQVQQVPGVRYLRVPGPPSSCLYKEQVFQQARGTYVLCCDSHVFFELGAIDALLKYFDEHPESSDLIMGPLVSITGRITATQQHLYVSEPLPPPQGAMISHGAVFRGNQFGAWTIDERGLDPCNPAYEIQQQGTFAFACRRAVWPSFHPQFYGFGGNETYLMEKFRARGNQVLCLPAFRAIHSFFEPEGKPYTPVLIDRIYNYLIGFQELGRQDLYQATVECFQRTNPNAVQQAIGLLRQPPEGPRPGTRTVSAASSSISSSRPRHPLEAEYHRLRDQLGRAPEEVLPFSLFLQLSMIRTDMRVLEYGSNISTLWFASRGVSLTTIEQSPTAIDTITPLVDENVHLIQSDFAGTPAWYNWEPDYGELYDVIVIGRRSAGPNTASGRRGGLGQIERLLAPGGRIFVDDTDPPSEFEFVKELGQRLGLTPYAFKAEQRQFHVLIAPPQSLGEGPGTQLTQLFDSHKFPQCQQCEKLSRQMNAWGVTGCREHFDQIVADILPRAKTWLKAKKPWAQALLGSVGLEETALKREISKHVIRAIAAAERAEKNDPEARSGPPPHKATTP